MIVPTSTGQIFVSDELSIKNDIAPTQQLDADHPFVPFVKLFWDKITTPGTGDLLMDCYSMLHFGIDAVSEASRQYVRTQLRRSPPDIVLILNNVNQPLYRFHQRTAKVWHYICIDKETVDRWADLMEWLPNDYQTLALEAMLKTTIIHETGHWHYTLARTKLSYWNELC